MNEKEPVVSKKQLVAWATAGTDADWEKVDASIRPEHLVALSISDELNLGLTSENKNVRDLAATLIARSDVELEPETLAALEEQMETEKDKNPLVRYWLSNALWKRGIRNSRVAAAHQEALAEDNPAGEFARALDAK